MLRVATLLLVLGCVADRSGFAPRVRPDGGVREDASIDAAMPRDADVLDDASVDAGVDGGFDAGADGGVDGGIDGGIDAGPTDEMRCRERFGDAPGFQLCAASTDVCELYVRFERPDNNCNAVCSRRGATCVGSYDDGDPIDCERGGPVECGGNFQDRICLCGPDDGRGRD
ncbi:MAG: hypothetical protein KC586_04130 [Myxococcales bacterium]|nr:hypothetical protein [Myxococcales bacterium]